MFKILIDVPDGQFDLDYSRESEAWAEFWKQVSQMADDGTALGGPLDAERVLAARTGTSETGRRWVISLVQS